GSRRSLRRSSSCLAEEDGARVGSRRLGEAYFSLAAASARPALAQAISLSAEGAPLTPITPTSSLPILIGIAPPASTPVVSFPAAVSMPITLPKTGCFGLAP